MKGVLDRFEGDQAVILLEAINEELILAKEDLPDGSKVNTIFKINKQNEHYQIIGIDHDSEIKMKESTSDLLAKLRAKQTESKFRK
ncbi:DUF3006 domain-containing protein [Ornithinibacillus xuwenensis]|uniref:DUF3006 domain-containing protein n=1 Tax=Ornithinibacillus xuwenensis TaxID=3144668 RepID=A0ABU9XJT6_9BACI